MTFNFVSFQQLHQDIKEFCATLPDFDAIIGVPRSGTFIANLIALYKNTRFGVLNGNDFLILQGGLRDQTAEIKSVLVFDDSVSTGVSMESIKEKLDNKRDMVKFGCLYIEQDTVSLVDYYHRIIPSPRMFEWNFMNHGLLTQACVDIDGVLCNDYSGAEHLEEDHIANAVCLHKPRYRIHSIVSGRLDKYAQQVYDWLEKNGIEYDNLYLRPSRDESAEEFKARKYAESPCLIFIESADNQAQFIADKTNKPVLCTDTMGVYYGESIW